MDAKRNGDGYFDPTAYAAITKADKDIERVRKLIRTLFYICDLAGFQVEGRIVLVDKESGKVWK